MAARYDYLEDAQLSSTKRSLRRRAQGGVRCAAAAAVLAVMLGGSAVQGQALPDSLEGRRVRVTLTSDARPVEGHVAPQVLRGLAMTVGADSLLVRIHPAVAPTVVDVDGIARLEISHGVSRVSTALYRGLRSILPATTIGMIADEPFGLGGIEATLVTGSLGFLLGAALGAVFPEEQWKAVSARGR